MVLRQGRAGLVLLPLAVLFLATGMWNVGVGRAAADPLPIAAGIFRLGAGPGAATAGMPYVDATGATGVLTARHVVGDPSPTHWALTDASGNAGYGVNVAASASTDAAFLQGSTQWSGPIGVKLSDDTVARFAYVATPADVKPGDRVCRTGWSPLDGDGVEADGSPDIAPPPDIPSRGANVICGRVRGFGGSDTLIEIYDSDRPDGALTAAGDSGAVVWKVTDDGAFMFIGMMTGAAGPTGTTVDGTATFSLGFATAAWAYSSDPALDIRPLTQPDTHPFFVIAPSTYHPGSGGSITVQGSLRDAANVPIAGAPVQVMRGPSPVPVATVITDSDGNLSWTSPGLDAAAGSVQLSLRYGGDAGHVAAASRVITISPTVASMPVPAPATVPSGSTFTVTAHVADTTGSPVPGRVVSLQIYPGGGTGFSVAATATTDRSGNAMLTSPPVTSTEGYAVRLAGDDPATNGDPFGAAASAIGTVSPR